MSLAAAVLSDPLYTALNALVANLGAGVWASNVVCAAIFAEALVLFCSRQPIPALALAVSIPVLVVIVAMNFTRQATAIALLMFAYDLQMRERRSPALLLVLLACTCHWSAVIFLPLTVLLATGRSIALRWGIASGALVGLAALTAYFLAPAFQERILASHPPAGALIRVGLSVAALSALLATRRLNSQETPGDGIILTYLSGMTIFVATILPLMSEVSDRLNLYLVPYQMMAFSRAAQAAPPPSLRVVVSMLVIAPGLAVFSAWILFSRYEACMAPYQTYLDGKVDWFLSSPQPFRSSNKCNEIQDRPRAAYPPRTLQPFQAPGATLFR